LSTKIPVSFKIAELCHGSVILRGATTKSRLITFIT